MNASSRQHVLEFRAVSKLFGERPVLDRLYREVGLILESPEMRKRFELEGAEAIRMPPAEMTAFVAKETEKWTRVVKEAGIKPE